MKKYLCFMVIVFALIGVSFVWGCGADSTVAGNENVIKAETIRADTVLASSFHLVDNNGNLCGLMSVSDDGNPMINLYKGDNTFTVHLSDKAPFMRLESGNNKIFILIDDEVGPEISLYANDENVVMLVTIDGEGFVVTSDKNGKTTGTLPR